MRVFHPIGDRIVILPLSEDEISEGGLIMPDIAQEGVKWGKVIATGPGTKNWKMHCKINDTVVYPKFSARQVEANGETYDVISESETLSIITE